MVLKKTHGNDAEHNNTIHTFAQSELVGIQCGYTGMVNNGTEVSGCDHLQYKCRQVGCLPRYVIRVFINECAILQELLGDEVIWCLFDARAEVDDDRKRCRADVAPPL
jgi:hypothetical protein